MHPEVQNCYLSTFNRYAQWGSNSVRRMGRRTGERVRLQGQERAAIAQCGLPPVVPYGAAAGPVEHFGACQFRGGDAQFRSCAKAGLETKTSIPDLDISGSLSNETSVTATSLGL